MEAPVVWYDGSFSVATIYVFFDGDGCFRWRIAVSFVSMENVASSPSMEELLL